jgi:DNA-directed RNA polymerase specialized sigma subunit
VSDIFTYVVLGFVILGIIIILVTFSSIKQTGNKINERRQSEEFAIRAISASVSEADQTMEEINKAAQTIFEELEDKHQELLFLYNMIEERKNEEVGPASDIIFSDTRQKRLDSYKNPKLGKIRALYDQGMTEEEIAKTLGIGQGEVKLILSIGKGR